MYFQLEVNETLANAMRAATELRAEIGKVIDSENSQEIRTLDDIGLNQLYDNIGDVIGRIGDFMGVLLADKAIDEANKARNNNEN